MIKKFEEYIYIISFILLILVGVILKAYFSYSIFKEYGFIKWALIIFIVGPILGFILHLITNLIKR